MTIMSLIEERKRLEVAAKAIEAAIADMRRYRDQGQSDAGWAAAWAAVMMTADVIRTGLSAEYRVADAEFKAIDKGVDLANKFLSFWGHTPITRKTELMKTVDPEFKGASEFVEDVQKARAYLSKIKVHPPRHIAKPLNLVLDLATEMADDTILLMNTANMANNIARSANASIDTATGRLRQIKVKIRHINDQINELLERRERLQHTA